MVFFRKLKKKHSICNLQNHMSYELFLSDLLVFLSANESSDGLA